MTTRHGPDRSALALAIGVHALLLLAFLSLHSPDPPMASAQRPLAVFDVRPSPPPPPPVLPPPPRPPRAAIVPPGGAPPRSAAPPPVPDTTPQPLAPARPEPAAITSPFADDQGIAQLPGPGGGAGNGNGSGTGTGNGAGAGPPRYAGAEWIHKPDLAETLPYWPALSVKRRIGGVVRLGCIVPVPGRPRRCWVISETPAGIGFGRAAVAMSRLFRIRPIVADGAPLDLPVNVPVVFAMETAPAKAP